MSLALLSVSQERKFREHFFFYVNVFFIYAMVFELINEFHM